MVTRCDYCGEMRTFVRINEDNKPICTRCNMEKHILKDGKSITNN